MFWTRAEKGSHSRAFDHSHGGFTSKIHLMSDFYGQSSAFYLTGAKADNGLGSFSGSGSELQARSDVDPATIRLSFNQSTFDVQVGAIMAKAAGRAS